MIIIIIVAVVVVVVVDEGSGRRTKINNQPAERANELAEGSNL